MACLKGNVMTNTPLSPHISNITQFSGKAINNKVTTYKLVIRFSFLLFLCPGSRQTNPCPAAFHGAESHGHVPPPVAGAQGKHPGHGHLSPVRRGLLPQHQRRHPTRPHLLHARYTVHTVRAAVA